MLKCILTYHKIDFYIPNQLFISILLISNGYNLDLGVNLPKKYCFKINLLNCYCFEVI